MLGHGKQRLISYAVENLNPTDVTTGSTVAAKITFEYRILYYRSTDDKSREGRHGDKRLGCERAIIIHGL